MTEKRWPGATVTVNRDEFERFNRKYDALFEGVKRLAAAYHMDEAVRKAAREVLLRWDVA